MRLHLRTRMCGERGMRHGLRLQDLLVELAKLKEVGDEDPAALALQAALSLELHELLVSSAVLSKGIATDSGDPRSTLIPLRNAPFC